MSLSHPPKHPAGDHAADATSQLATDRASDVSPDEVLSLLDAEHTQTILEETRDTARPARVLAERCGASRATIYRRLNRLEDAGLVASRMAYDPDGHHRTVFESTLESLTIDVTTDGYTIHVETTPEDPSALQDTSVHATD